MSTSEQENNDQLDHEHKIEVLEIVRIAFVGLAIIAVWQKLCETPSGISIIGIVATLIGGYPIFKEAFENLSKKRMTMELSMTIALVAALAIGQFLTVLVIVIFVLIAEVLEGLTVGRGRQAIKHLLNFLPREAIVRRAGESYTIRANELSIDDVVLVKPGSRVPVDGIVVNGVSAVDQSTITGESMPVEKVAGSNVYAGTINQSGAIEVRTTGIGRDTAFGKIIETVEHADQVRAPIQKTADRLAGYLVYFALACAVLTYIITRDARSTISVIIVAGACGIAAGTPLAILGAIGRAARTGAIIKGGIYLEALGTADTIVFDKTGTLTYGTPRVTSIHTQPGVQEATLIETAAIAERKSEHPLAKAILDKAYELQLPAVDPDDFQYTPGKGIVCRSNDESIVVGNQLLLSEHGVALAPTDLASNTEARIFVARNGQLLGAINVADVLRPEAFEAMRILMEMGIQTVLLSGDSEAIATRIGAQLKVDKIYSNLLPDQKVEAIRTLRSAGHKVAMVGDGINDAPALIEANVGVAMGSGTDVARESADVVLLGNDLLKFVESVKIAKWCRQIIYQNFIGTLVVDGIGVGLAAFGLLNPLFAALIHVSSELVFILNSTRLLPRGISRSSKKEVIMPVSFEVPNVSNTLAKSMG